jgi:hypothetical protein
LLGDRADDLPLVEASFGAPHEHRIRGEKVKQRITDFELDDESHWRAVLECGHRQHVRHDPPLRSREWVLTDAGRREKIGLELECRKCDENVE